jgi:ferric-dicitrate binding protein FerR (iron transport regulator)
MEETYERIAGLLYRLLKNEVLDNAEQQELDTWLATSNYNRQLLVEVMNEGLLEEDIRDLLQRDKRAAWQLVAARIDEEKKAVSLQLIKRWWPAAAILIAVLGAGAYFLLRPPVPPPVVKKEEPATDIVAGTNRATLILADNSMVVIDSNGKGALPQQGNTKVTQENSQLIYNEITKLREAAPYNILRTQRGEASGLLRLADGTTVWLNAASSIRFPVSFAGSQRVVEITGEAYFEVAKEGGRPFVVRVNNKADVTVLGTHFNVNAYDDEGALTATLLEGAVRINNGTVSGLLAPGQQAVVQGNGEIKINKDVNVEQVVSWKQGFFNFRRDSIETVMRQVARWYNAEIVYRDKITETFNGEITKQVGLSTLLRRLESTGGVHFQISGRKIIVLQ